MPHSLRVYGGGVPLPGYLWPTLLPMSIFGPIQGHSWQCVHLSVKMDSNSRVSPRLVGHIKGWGLLPFLQFSSVQLLSHVQLFVIPWTAAHQGSLSITNSWRLLKLMSIKVVSSAYRRLLIFLLTILIPACASSSPAFLMMYSACKLNNQGDNIQPWRTPFPIWNQSVVPCPVLTVASLPAYRFLNRQVRWSGIPISFRIFHSLLWSTQLKPLI